MEIDGTESLNNHKSNIHRYREIGEFWMLFNVVKGWLQKRYGQSITYNLESTPYKKEHTMHFQICSYCI